VTEVPAGLAAAVEVLFGDRAALGVRFAEHLAGTGVERGLIGPREVPRLWERHLLNCAAVAGLVPAGVEVADVGSGAGLPGLVLAIARPDLRMTLVEPLLRRTVWLDEVVQDLGLSGVTVHRGRAEEWAGPVFEVVTARAVAELGRLWGWCGPMVRPGGRLLALKGETAEEELAAARPGLSEVAEATVHRCGEGLLAQPTLVVALTRGEGRPAGGRAGSERTRKVTGRGPAKRGR
jgi:16S rRNA (guanine527-N7)-methyltransferase